jgi:hypothetical protein
VFIVRAESRPLPLPTWKVNGTNGHWLIKDELLISHPYIVAKTIQSHIFFFYNLFLLKTKIGEPSSKGGEILSSILDKAKRKTEEGARKASNAAKDFGQKAEDEARKGARKVSRK